MLTQCPTRLSVGWPSFLIQTVKMPGWQCQRTNVFALVWMENSFGVVLEYSCHGKASPQWQSFLLASLLQCVCLSASGPLFFSQLHLSCELGWVGSYRPMTSNVTLISSMLQSSFNHSNKTEMNQCCLPISSRPFVLTDAWASRYSKWYPLLFLPGSCIWSIMYSDWLISLKVAQIHLGLSTHMSPPSSKLSTPWMIVATALCQVGFLQTENPMEPFSFSAERPMRRPPPTL